jgi:hypothetical protein
MKANWLSGRRADFLKVLAVNLLATAAHGTAVSYTGTLATPESVFETTFALPASTTLTVQTWGFGGGTNAAGQVVPSGGLDSLIALFSGPDASATMYTDGSGNPLADADNLLNAPWSYVGNCPPAGTVAIGSNSDCGDDLMQVVLAPGTYTLVLTDANYIPNAVFDNGALSEGFTDLTAGVFQTCDPVSNACITPSGNYAVDVTSTAGFTPEPGALWLIAAGLAALCCLKQLRKTKGEPV